MGENGSGLRNNGSGSGFKVLFIYCNPRKMSLVPPSIAIFSALLKSINVNVALFDTSLYDASVGDYGDDEGGGDADAIQEKNLTVKPFSDSFSKLHIQYKRTDVFDDLENVINEYSPDLLAVTAVESTFAASIRLLKHIRHHRIPTILGGVFPTFAPQVAIAAPEIDIVCVGEGEKPIVELCKRMKAGKDYSDVTNLWVKQKDGRVIRNPQASLVNLDDNPLFDMGLFDERRFYRAMDGKIYKMFPVETHRGCPYKCAFCNSPLQNQMYKEQSNEVFFRRKSPQKVHEEISYYKSLGAEYLFFWADNFFAYPRKELDAFCEMYSDFKLPFFCQAHPASLFGDMVKKA